MANNQGRVEILEVNGVKVDPLSDVEFSRLEAIAKDAYNRAKAGNLSDDDAVALDAYKNEKQRRDQLIQGGRTAKAKIEQKQKAPAETAAPVGEQTTDAGQPNFAKAEQVAGTTAQLAGDIAGTAVEGIGLMRGRPGLGALAAPPVQYGVERLMGVPEKQAGLDALMGPISNLAGRVVVDPLVSLATRGGAALPYPNAPDAEFMRASQTPIWKDAGVQPLAGMRQEWPARVEAASEFARSPMGRTPVVGPLLSKSRQAVDRAYQFGEAAADPLRTLAVGQSNLRKVSEIGEKQFGDRVERIMAMENAGANVQRTMKKADELVAQQMSDSDFDGILKNVRDDGATRAVVIPKLKASVEQMRNDVGMVGDKSGAFGEIGELVNRFESDLNSKKLQNLPATLKNYRHSAGRMLGDMQAKMRKGDYVDPQEFAVAARFYHEDLIPAIKQFMPAEKAAAWDEFRPKFKEYINNKQALLRDMEGGKAGAKTISDLMRDPKKFDAMMYFNDKMGVSVVDDIRQAIIFDALRVSKGSERAFPSAKAFRDNMAKTRASLRDADNWGRVFGGETGQKAMQDAEDFVSVLDVVSRTAKQTNSDVTQDMLSREMNRYLDGSGLSPWFIVFIYKHFPKWTGAERIAAQSVLNIAAGAGGATAGRFGYNAAYPKETETTDPRLPLAQRVRSGMEALTGKPRSPAPELSNDRLQQLTRY